MANFDEATKLSAWVKGVAVQGYNPSIYRQDDYGTWMKWSEYGDREAVYGWEIDHIKPVADGGRDNLSNLRPLHWQNNASKQDGRL